MATTPLAGKIVVSIVSTVVQVSPPAWHIEYDVRNTSDATIWLVIDESLVFREEGDRIELSFARGRMQPAAHPFGYFDPTVVAIATGQRRRQSVDITWPSRLSDLWNDRREARPSPGEYDVSVRVGFAPTRSPPAPKAGEGVETPVLRWQEEAVSPPVRLTIPPYSSRP